MVKLSPIPLALALLATTASPAFADTAFEMRASYEQQSFTWKSLSNNASLIYTAPMMTYTVIDHTGGVFGAAMAVSQTEGNRKMAEREAIRKGANSYSYVREAYRAREGTRFGFQVGQGGLTNPAAAGSGPIITGGSSRMARILLEGDIADVGPGAIVFDTGVAFWGATFTPTGQTQAVDIEAWNWPLGLRYRWAAAFLPGLVIEPHANFDWLVSLAGAVNGKPNFDARNFGVEVGYHVLPQVKLRLGYSLNRLAHNQVSWMKNEEIVDMTNLTAGATVLF